MERDGGTQEVELVDGDTEPRGPGPARVRPWWLLLGTVAVVLVLAAVQWVVDAREDAAVSRLVAVPGALDPLGDELEVVRRLGEEETRSLWSSIPVADHTWASIRVGEDGSQAFTATDLRSGETVWSTPLLGPDPGRAAGREKRGGGACRPGAADPATTSTWAVCTVTDGDSTISLATGEEPTATTTTRVAVLDTGDGHLIAEWAVQPDARIDVLPGLVLVGLRRDGRIEVVAHDARTGAERWRHAPDPGGPAEPAGSWSFGAAGELVAYGDGDHLTVLSSTGTVVRTDLPNPAGHDLGPDLGTGLPALPTVSSDGQDTTETTTLLARDADPARDRVLVGRIVHLAVDDGSVPGLVLTSRDRLYAWDQESGAPRWDRDLAAGYDALVVRGRVYLCSASSIVALDGRTGEPEWEADAPSCPYSGLATDGQDVLVTSITTSAGAGGMTGYDFATGEQTRRFPLPEGVVELGTYREELLGYSRTFEEVAVLR